MAFAEPALSSEVRPRWPVRLLLLLSLATLAVVGRAQPGAALFERAVVIEPRLPQSSVYEVLEDRQGFLWFATREGLGRWDGYTMRTWRRQAFDAGSLPGNVVRQLIEDATGDLWAVTEATDRRPTGVARLVGPAHDEVRRYEHAHVRLFVGPDGAAWLADSLALHRFDAAQDRFVRVRPRLRRTAPTGGLATRDGTLWVTSDDGLEAYAPDGRARRVDAPPGWGHPTGSSDAFHALAEAPDGTLWVGGVHLGRLDRERRAIERVPGPMPVVQGYGTGLAVGTILPDATGLWLATYDGVYRFSFADGTFARHSLRLPGDIPTQNWVSALHHDRTGTLWAGTVWGLHRAAPAPPPFRLLAHDPDDPNSLGSGIILSIHRDTQGTMWVGTLGGGLNRIGADGRVTRYRSGPAGSPTHDWIWALASDDRTLWIGTGLSLDAVDLDRPSRVRRVALDAGQDPHNPEGAQGLWTDADQTLWFGFRGRLWRKTARGDTASTAAPFASGIQAIRTVPGGAWVGTSDGLYRYDTARDAFEGFRHDPDDPTSLSDDATIALHLDLRGRLWVGTQGGLSRYEGDGRFDHLTAADGLPSNVVYGILEDDAGRLWISTNRGLARYDESATPRIRAFTVEDGVGNVEFNRGAAFRDADGTMYFGGDRGVTVFHPDALDAPAPVSPVVLTAVHRSTRAGTTTERYVGPEGVSLAPDETTVEIEFAALDFLNGHQSRYAVWLDGWDDGWVEVGDRRRVSFTNLPPDRYAFRVRAANADGIWGAETVVPLVVRPALHQTAWFQWLSALALLGLVAGVGWDVSRRRYRRELAALEAQRALEAERSRISRDMHDEVGASLSEIAVLSEVARRQLGEAAVTEERLTRIADSSRLMLERLGQIVWAVNPRNDRLPALAGYLREHAARYLDAHGLTARLAFPARLPDVPVSAEIRRTALLVLKEALHNAAKHAEANAIGVSFEVVAGRVLLTIRDDGRGFTEASGDGAAARFIGGNGLGNMASRARDAGGTLAVTSAPGTGCTVRLDIPLVSPPGGSSVDVRPRVEAAP